MPVKSPFTGEERIWIVKADGTVSQRCISKFKIEVRICKYAIQKIHNEQDNLRINQNRPIFASARKTFVKMRKARGGHFEHFNVIFCFLLCIRIVDLLPFICYFL